MRLTLVIGSLRCGGAERVATVLANAWAKRGDQVTIVTLSAEKPFYPLGPAVRHVPLGLASVSPNFLAAVTKNCQRIIALRNHVKEQNPHFVISFMDKMNVLLTLACIGADCGVVTCEHTDPSQYKLGKVWATLRVLTYPLADTTTFLTEKVMRRWRPLLGTRATVMPNPVTLPEDFEITAAVPREKEILAMGRLVREKGFDDLLKAFAIIARQYPLWSVSILGDGPLLSSLQREAGELGIQQQIRFHGQVSDPFPFLRRAGMFVMPSRFEGFPCALVEAMCCGAPVISFDCHSGPSELIKHGRNGLLVAARDVTALAAGMKRLIEDPACAARLGQNATSVLQQLSVAKTLSRWDRLFATIRRHAYAAAGQADLSPADHVSSPDMGGFSAS